MMTNSTEAPDLASLRDKTLGLRESVNGTRARLHGQRETLRRLRAELTALRRLAAEPVPAPAAKEASPRRRVSPAKFLPYAALAAFAVASQFPARRPAPLPAIAPPTRFLRAEPVAADDDRGDEAIALVHEWRVPGDDRPIVERVRQPSELPGARPAWNVERTGETTYLVTFRPEDAEPSLEFEVDLDARRVDPSPDTSELLTQRARISPAPVPRA